MSVMKSTGANKTQKQLKQSGREWCEERGSAEANGMVFSRSEALKAESLVSRGLEGDGHGGMETLDEDERLSVGNGCW